MKSLNWHEMIECTDWTWWNKVRQTHKTIVDFNANSICKLLHVHRHSCPFSFTARRTGSIVRLPEPTDYYHRHATCHPFHRNGLRAYKASPMAIRNVYYRNARARAYQSHSHSPLNIHWNHHFNLFNDMAAVFRPWPVCKWCCRLNSQRCIAVYSAMVNGPANHRWQREISNKKIEH